MMKTHFVLVLFALVGCVDERPVAPPAPEIGCDDPALWSASAPVAYADAEVGSSDPCDSAQFPLRKALVQWHPPTFEESHEFPQMRTCWRVTEASPGSGWSAGQFFSTTNTSSSMNLTGFGNHVTVEGRVVRPDNTVAFTIPSLKIELQPAQVVEPAASNVVAVMAADAWAEHDAVHLWGQRIATDEVLDAATIRVAGEYGYLEDPVTLHRVGDNVVRRTWSQSNGSIEHADLVIGPGTTGRLTRFGKAAIIGSELVVFGLDASQNASVLYRIPLGAAPLEVTEGSDVTLHMPGMLTSVDLLNGTYVTLPVGDGVLLQASQSGSPSFFDGTTFRHIYRTSTALTLDERYPYTPPAEAFARIGKPLADLDGVYIGDHGFFVIDESGWGVTSGPTSATFAELFGDGHIGPMSADNAAYVVVHDSGSAELYAAPYGGHCDFL